MTKQYCFLVIYLLLSTKIFAQKIHFSGEIDIQGLTSAGEELPFWMYSNTRGRVSDNSNFMGVISSELSYNPSPVSSLEVGSGVFYSDGLSHDIFFDELYLEYNYKWLGVTTGRKQYDELYNGLSASNENILWSLNSRPIPGIQIRTEYPIFFSSRQVFGFEASYSEYRLEAERFMRRANIHHKFFRLIFNSQDFQFKIGLQHFAQWGGTSKVKGKQPDTLEAYLRIITGKAGTENASIGDQSNALGNHLGGYEIYITKSFAAFNAELIYNHLFDDKSGMRLGNTPDGRYGLFINLKEQKWLDSFIYEFYYTKHQSSTTSGAHIWDNYFNNFLYRSGWTYEERVIGTPFFVPNHYDEEHAAGFIRIGNNKFIAHHIGISGKLWSKYPYRVLTSYRRNYGHYQIAGDYKSEYYPPEDIRGKNKIQPEVTSSLLEITYPNSFFNVTFTFGGDFSSTETNLGFGINLKKQL
ncbi:capsule assembly Wzi family protein [Salinimicrobium catena]|uniref:capsule assembly Wzi family protein n=1 Tax=Salinimicrobium catena TaxID=390640 RepID=UPI002FE4AB2A